MPEPVFPVDSSFKDEDHIVFTGDGSGMRDLAAVPVLDDAGSVVTRWHFTWRERLRLLFRGELFVTTLTFYSRFQPLALSIESPLRKGDELKRGR